mgnify:CR=1 FL=1
MWGGWVWMYGRGFNLCAGRDEQGEGTGVAGTSPNATEPNAVEGGGERGGRERAEDTCRGAKLGVGLAEGMRGVGIWGVGGGRDGLGG